MDCHIERCTVYYTTAPACSLLLCHALRAIPEPHEELHDLECSLGHHQLVSTYSMYVLANSELTLGENCGTLRVHNRRSVSA